MLLELLSIDTYFEMDFLCIDWFWEIASDSSPPDENESCLELLLDVDNVLDFGLTGF